MDDDILSQGGDRDPSRWPRRVAVIGTPILVAVAVIVYLTVGRHPHSPAAAPSASAAASTAPVSVGLDAPGPPAEPDGIGGPTLPWAGTLRLPVAGMQPVWFSPATGRSEAIGGLPADSSGYQFTRVDGGWAVQANSGGNTECGDCSVPPLPVWFLADGSRSVTRVGTANQVTPAATAGAVWLTSYPPTADTGTVARTAREVNLAGAPLGPPVSLPPGYVIYQATGHGLLLAPVTQQPGTQAYRLWNPAKPQASRTFDNVIAASPAEIAWTPRCAATCQVRLLDLATGRQTAVNLPAGSSAAGGAFSPTGDLLALQLSSGDDGALAMRLDVASVTSGRLTAVPGTSVSSDALVGFGWPTSADSLVAEFIFATKVQLASWQPGASRLAVAVIHPGQDQASLVVG
ncbi:MAG TPA: hypothetical protein VIZ43_05645 [Trebonia sp.]